MSVITVNDPSGANSRKDHYSSGFTTVAKDSDPTGRFHFHFTGVSTFSFLNKTEDDYRPLSSTRAEAKRASVKDPLFCYCVRNVAASPKLGKFA